MQDPHSKRGKNSAILICAAGSSIGIGHLSRILSLGTTLKYEFKFDVRIIIFTEEININLRNLSEFNPLLIKPLDGELLALTSFLNFINPNVITLDHHPSITLTPMQMNSFLKRKVCYVGIDPPIDLLSEYEINWFPTFYSKVIQTAKAKNYRLDNCFYGWNCFLLNYDEITDKDFNNTPNVLILTGSTNSGNLNIGLPNALDHAVKLPCHFQWVVGPFASDPVINSASIHHWQIIRSPSSLSDQYKIANYSISNFGISAIESMHNGLATIILSQNLQRDVDELNYLKSENVCIISSGIKSAASNLNKLLTDPRMASQLSSNARSKFSKDGSYYLSQIILNNLQKNR